MVWSCHVKWHDGCQSKENIKAEKERFAVFFVWWWYEQIFFILCTLPTVKLWEQSSYLACHWKYGVVFSSFLHSSVTLHLLNIKRNHWWKMRIIFNNNTGNRQDFKIIFSALQTCNDKSHSIFHNKNQCQRLCFKIN